ncbi:MAG: hypothetical protein ACRDM1_01195 [Gaiellaceae bacterium]
MRIGVLALCAVAGLLACAQGALAATGPVAASRPTIAGTLQQGKKLTGSPGTWTGSGTIAYAYQWYRCDPSGAHCSSIHGSTTATYTQVAKDVGHTLALTVRATDSTGTTPAYSSLAGLVAPAGGTAPTEQPPLTGDPIAGQPLGVDSAAAGAAYAWLQCNANGRLCTPIPGATASSYTVAAGNDGHVLLATVTTPVTTAVGGKQTVLSQSSGLARTAPGPVASARPSISGTLEQGRKLAANAGTWAGSGTIVYAYQWYRCDQSGAHCSSIHGSTKPTYTQVAADVGRTIAVTVRATDSTGTTPAYSSLAGLVAPAAATLAVTAQPTLTGTAAAGQPLKVSGGRFVSTPASPSYGWLRCNPNGRLCTPIAGATADTYTVAAADAGHALVATVTVAAGSTTQVALTTAATVF